MQFHLYTMLEAARIVTDLPWSSKIINTLDLSATGMRWYGECELLGRWLLRSDQMSVKSITSSFLHKAVKVSHWISGKPSTLLSSTSRTSNLFICLALVLHSKLNSF